MMDMQKEMANQYFEAVQNGQWDPNMPPPFPLGNPNLMMPGFFPPGMHGGQGYSQQGMPQQNGNFGTSPTANVDNSSQAQDESNPLFEQAQAMLDDALGEEADSFKEILGSFGMSDKEFWKGAMVGAAAALLISNDNVRGKLMGMVSSATDALKSGSGAVKNTAVDTASTVKENVAAGGEIFRDTYSAGKQGFQDSVEKHRTKPVTADQEITKADDEQPGELNPQES